MYKMQESSLDTDVRKFIRGVRIGDHVSINYNDGVFFIPKNVEGYVVRLTSNYVGILPEDPIENPDVLSKLTVWGDVVFRDIFNFEIRPRKDIKDVPNRKDILNEAYVGAIAEVEYRKRDGLWSPLQAIWKPSDEKMVGYVEAIDPKRIRLSVEDPLNTPMMPPSREISLSSIHRLYVHTPAETK